MTGATTLLGAVTYRYNALGQRYLKTLSGTATVYLYDDAGHLIAETSNGGTSYTEYLWLGDTPVATIKPGSANLYYIHTDHLDTPRLIANQTPATVWRWDNDDPFGANMANANPSGLGAFGFNLRLPGQYLDAETNNYYNYFRGYSPEIGRYIQSDPIGAVLTPQLYGYVDSDPISYADPLGLAKPSTQAQVEAAIARGDAKALEGMIESGGLSEAELAAAQSGLQNLQIIARSTESPNLIAQLYKRPVKQIKQAIEQCKQKGLPRNGPNRNPDVIIDPSNGNVYPKTPNGIGDPIGTILDYLPH
jgi:RHS repeat-associated protein